MGWQGAAMAAGGAVWEAGLPAGGEQHVPSGGDVGSDGERCSCTWRAASSRKLSCVDGHLCRLPILKWVRVMRSPALDGGLALDEVSDGHGPRALSGLAFPQWHPGGCQPKSLRLSLYPPHPTPSPPKLARLYLSRNLNIHVKNKITELS